MRSTQSIFIAPLLVLAITIAHAAKAEMRFVKTNDGSIRLTIRDDGTASIVKTPRRGRSEREMILIDGKIVGEKSSWQIIREEGDVCPAVSIELFHDIRLGENQYAQVRNRFEDAGSAARTYCGQVTVMDGGYVRVASNVNGR